MPSRQTSSARVAKSVRVNGIVQGVGFRPFVYRLAVACRLKGHVANTQDGVVIHAEGLTENIDAFIEGLKQQPPPIARIDYIDLQPAEIKNCSRFDILPSETSSNRQTLIAPDIAVCDDCLADIRSIENRRYGYPFTNCTNCGPRYTILEDLPYDRENTVMRTFTMCPACDREYHHISDRRFHAQPNACGECGPRLRLFDHRRREIVTPRPLSLAVDLLKQGRTIAVKGIGGFHIVVNARSDEALQRLRRLKNRPAKPLAVMSADLDHIRRYARVDPIAREMLEGRQRPIVLLPKQYPFMLSDWIAPDNGYIGCMLPYTPLHEMLFDDTLIALVMTSGNMNEEPIVIDNSQAFEKLSLLAEYFLIHDRDIVIRCDDSVAMIAGGKTRLIRRARGFVPGPVYLREKSVPVLACGPEQKNTVCLTKNNMAFMSQHIGDMTNAEVYAVYRETIEHLKRILNIDPQVFAHDAHPNYLTTGYAQELAGDKPCFAIQHHHAHLVSCMAENHIEAPAIGIAFDGTGYGTDGAVWGGEVMICELGRFERIGHLEYVPLPGGDTAIREPWRMGVSYLRHTWGEALYALDLPILRNVSGNKVKMLCEMIDKRINTPPTSSMGRLFDGVAAIIGLPVEEVSFEGQAAMALESLAAGYMQEFSNGYEYVWEQKEVATLSIAPIIRSIVQDVVDGVASNIISAKFHNTLITLAVEFCRKIRKSRGLNKVVLSGGVFQNRVLLTGILQQLESNGFQTYSHAEVPTNDGGIALGQAVAAAMCLKQL